MLSAPASDFNEPNPNRIWRDSLSACFAALALFAVTMTIDLARFSGRIWLPAWLSVGGVEDARVIMSALLSAVSTVLALMFTVIMLVLSVAATWFGPRLMSRFVGRSRLASWIMGLFLASFLGCLLALVAIHESGGVVFVPQVTLIATIALVAYSFFALVYFCQRVAEVIQIGNLLTILIQDLRRVIREMPATLIIDPATERFVRTTIPAPSLSKESIEAEREHCTRLGAPILASRSGYLQAVDHMSLFLLAHRSDAVIHLMFRPGQFITSGSILAYVRPAKHVVQLEPEIDSAHVLGRQRTLKQDLEFGMAQLVEIALRALSPAVNDTYTGVYCVDWLGEALLELALVPPSDGCWRTSNGTIRVLEPALRYGRFVKAGFDQLRQAAANNPAVSIRLFQTFARMLSQLGQEEHRQAVQLQVEALWEMVAAVPACQADRRDIQAAYELTHASSQPPTASIVSLAMGNPAAPGAHQCKDVRC
jgi:uncharacterized membrane protein